MPSKLGKPAVGQLTMTLRSRGRDQAIETKESKPGVTEEEPKRKVRKNLKKEDALKEQNNNVAKAESEQNVVREISKPDAKGLVESRKQEGKEMREDVKLAKVVEVKKKTVRQHKAKNCGAPKDGRTEVQNGVFGNEESNHGDTESNHGNEGSSNIIENFNNGNELSDDAKAVRGNRKKCGTTAAHRLQSRQTGSDAMSAESQEEKQLETFSTEDWGVIEGIKERAERVFGVKLAVFQEEHSKAASVTISGSNREKCLLCKEYLFALMRPGCKTIFQYPTEKHSFLTNGIVHEKLERDSQAILIFRHIGEVEIYGIDSLSVALAMSSLECLLESHLRIESNAPSASCKGPEKTDSKKHQESSRRSSLLLDAELKNWVSGSDDDVYRNTSEAVRHSILSVVKDESREARIEATNVRETPPNVASPALFSSALKLLSDAYMSILDDSVALLSPSTADGDLTTSLGMGSVKKNILKDPDFANCSVQLIDRSLPSEAETMHREIGNSVRDTETERSEIDNYCTAGNAKEDVKNLVIEAETKQKEITSEYVMDREPKRTMSCILVSSDSENKAQTDQRGVHCRTTSVRSNCVERKVYLQKNNELSCEIGVPGVKQTPGQTINRKTDTNLSSAQLDSTWKSCKHGSMTLDHQMGSSITKTVQGNSVPATKLSDSLKQVQISQKATAVGSNPVVPPVVYPLLSIDTQQKASSLACASRLRYIVIDGSNVAMA